MNEFDDQMTVPCPSCEALLRVPVDSGGRFARCPNCKEKFTIPSPAAMMDETVAGWLIDEEDLDDDGAADNGAAMTVPHSHSRVPEYVRHRLPSWFDSQVPEHCLIYLPDARIPESGAEHAGLVVSEQRIIFHHNEDHRSIWLHAEGELSIARNGAHYDVHYCHGRRRRHKTLIGSLARDDAHELMHLLDELQRPLRVVRG